MTGAKAMAASAPSGRRSVAQVTAKVKVSAVAHRGRSWKRAMADMASARAKSVGSFRERFGGVGGGEWAKRCQPQGGQPSAAGKPSWLPPLTFDARSGKISQQ